MYFRMASNNVKILNNGTCDLALFHISSQIAHIAYTRSFSQSLTHCFGSLLTVYSYSLEPSHCSGDSGAFIALEEVAILIAEWVCPITGALTHHTLIAKST
jgi:hypothetical protein